MSPYRRGFIWVRRRSRKAGRRHVEMVCGLKNHSLAAKMARGLGLIDSEHVYTFSNRGETEHKCPDFFVDESEDFDIEAYLLLRERGVLHVVPSSRQD